MVWESDPRPQIIWGNSSIVLLQFFKQAMNKVTGLIMRFQSFSNTSHYSAVPFSFFPSLPPSLLPSWKCLTENARKKTGNYVSERKAKILEMLPSDWRVCIYSFLTLFIQTQAETDEQEVVERPQEDPVIARRVESVHRREAQKEGDGRMEEKGTQHSWGLQEECSPAPAPSDGAEHVSPARPVWPAACSPGHSGPQAAPQLKTGVKRNCSPGCLWGPNGLTEKALREGPGTQ